MNQEEFFIKQTRNVIIGLLVLSAMVGTCGELNGRRVDAIRAASPTVRTCIEHSREDKVQVTR